MKLFVFSNGIELAALPDPEKIDMCDSLQDIKLNDKLVLFIFALLIIILGLYPNFITNNTVNFVDNLLITIHKNNSIN